MYAQRGNQHFSNRQDKGKIEKQKCWKTRWHIEIYIYFFLNDYSFTVGWVLYTDEQTHATFHFTTIAWKNTKQKSCWLLCYPEEEGFDLGLLFGNILQRKEKIKITPSRVLSRCAPLAVFHSFFSLSDFCLLYSHTPLSHSSSQLFLACGQILFNHALCGRDCTHTKNWHPQKSRHHVEEEEAAAPNPPPPSLPYKSFCVKILISFIEF